MLRDSLHLLHSYLRIACTSRTALVVACVGVCVAGVSTQSPRFYPDDPIAREPSSQDAAKAQAYEIESFYEMSHNLFVTAGHEPSGQRARNLNSIDEVPDSDWFTNRIGARPLTPEELAIGPAAGQPPDPSQWVLVHQKTSGVHPGFTARDARGETWFLQFDPSTNPEGATAAVEIATKFFWAFGYNQVETFLTTFDLAHTSIDPKATKRRPSGARTPFTWDDVHAILEHVARNPDGKYRVVAGRLIRGRILGNFLYDGTRPDDPNDIVPHEHRRELRGLRVFASWANLTDLKASNTLDTVIEENGRSIVKHYLQDVGSTFGMCNDVHEWDLSYEYFYEADATRRRFYTLGFSLSPWQKIHYEHEYPSIGKFEGKKFDPRAWRPQTPTTAYLEMRDDDAFWAARRVAAMSDELIRAAVHTGAFSDPHAEKYLGDVLIERRDKIARTYLTAINPIVDPRFDTAGRLTFSNAAFDTRAADSEAVTYHAAWMRFDNATGETSPLANTQSTTSPIAAPPNLPAAPDSYIQVDLSIDSRAHPSWRQPIRTWFRRTGEGWTLVGLERIPEDINRTRQESTR